MLVTQYLKNYSLEQLQADHGIEVCEHPTLPLCILNYSQINSQKSDLIANECRGLCLEKETWTPVLRSFKRFFNYEEHLEETKKFEWDKPFLAQEKIDGSLISVGTYKDNLLVNTRGSFGFLPAGYSDKTWREHVLDILIGNDITKPFEFSTYTESEAREAYLWELCANHTLVFEFCSPLTQVVKIYQEPTMYLLTMFDTLSGREVSVDFCDLVAKNLCVLRPKLYSLSSLESIQRWIDDLQDPTDEGLVLRDCNDLRLKMKSARYVALHRLKGNDNIFATKNLLPLVLANDTEVRTLFPLIVEKYDKIQSHVIEIEKELTALWDSAKNLESQKDFALAVKSHKLSGILFTARAYKKHPCEILRSEPKFMLRHFENVEKKILRMAQEDSNESKNQMEMEIN